MTNYGRLHMFDLKGGAFKRALLEAGNGLGDVSVSPDGRTVATIGQHLEFWDVEARAFPVGSLPTNLQVTVEESRPFQKSHNGAWGKAVAFAPDGAWITALGSFTSRTGHADALVQIDPSNGKLFGAACVGFSDATCLALSADGMQIAIGFESPRIEIREAAAGSLIQSIDLGDFGAIRSIAYIDKGRLAVAAAAGRRVLIVSAAHGRCIHELNSDR